MHDMGQLCVRVRSCPHDKQAGAGRGGALCPSVTNFVSRAREMSTPLTRILRSRAGTVDILTARVAASQDAGTGMRWIGPNALVDMFREANFISAPCKAALVRDAGRWPADLEVSAARQSCADCGWRVYECGGGVLDKCPVSTLLVILYVGWRSSRGYGDLRIHST